MFSAVYCQGRRPVHFSLCQRPDITVRSLGNAIYIVYYEFERKKFQLILFSPECIDFDNKLAFFVYFVSFFVIILSFTRKANLKQYFFVIINGKFLCSFYISKYILLYLSAFFTNC